MWKIAVSLLRSRKNLCAAQKLDIYSKNGAVVIQKDWRRSHFIKVYISLK